MVYSGIYLTIEVLNYPKAIKMKPMLLNKKALAATLGCSPQTVLRLVKAGKLPQPVFGQFYYLPNVIRALNGQETGNVDAPHEPLPRLLTKGVTR